MGVTRTKYGYRVYYRGHQEYFATSKFGKDETAKHAADAYFAEMQRLLPKPNPEDIPMPYVSDTWTVSGSDRVRCFTIYYWNAKREKKNKKFIYENPDDRVEADRNAQTYLAARIREWEGC
jgi:hypothetical protein